MSRIYAEASEVIDARPEAIYAVLADYRNGHPHILPKEYFKELQIEQGGTGAGTLFNVRTQFMGVEKSFHMEVSEPEPGRVLVETDKAAGVVTTFTVTPVSDGQQARLQIATEWAAKPGFTGFTEKVMNPFAARRMYAKELRQVAEYMRSNATVSSAG